MCCLQSQEQWPSRSTSDSGTLCCEKGSHLKDGACDAIPFRHFTHHYSKLDTEALLERSNQINSPSAYYPTTPQPSQRDTEMVPKPNNISSTSSRTLSPMPLSQGDNCTLFLSSSPEVKMFPINATDFQRYERNITRPKHYNHSYHIHAKTTSFSPNSPPAGWTSLIHPEGAPFFHHETRRIFTDANLHDVGVHMALEEFARTIESRVRSFSAQLPERFDIVLDLILESPGKYNCGYYCANHDDRALFWLDDHDVSGILNEVNVQYTPSHVGHEIESQYWYHCELFPNARFITMDVLLELKDILVHNIGDSLTSSVSNAPYSVKELRHMLHLVNEMKDQVDKSYLGSICTFSRFMGTFAHERFLNLHGEHGARLCRDQTIHDGGSLRQTSIFRCINPATFYVAGIHLRTLQNTTVDHLVNKSRSSQTLIQLKSEWRDSTIYSILLLNANVMFLATHNNSNLQNFSHQINKISILASVGSAITGLLLSRQASTGKFNHFLAQRSVSSFGLEALAMMYSLPNALLIWAVISFFAALGIACVEVGDIMSYSLFGVAWAALISIVTWCISTSSESGSYVQPWIVRKWLDPHSGNPSEETEMWDSKGC